MPSSRIFLAGRSSVWALRIALLSLLFTPFGAQAQDGPRGITQPVVFAPHNPAAPACSVPPGLLKILGFAQDNEREFMQGVARMPMLTLFPSEEVLGNSSLARLPSRAACIRR